MARERISDAFAYPANYVEVDGSRIHYIDEGEGDPILFLHGIPTSGYLWRNIIPHLMTLGRCIAPDLVGFGLSDKPNISYAIDEQIHYIDKFIEALGLNKITLVMHGWGSIIGFDYASRHEANCKALVFYEAFLRSLSDVEDAVSLPLQAQLSALEEESEHIDYVNQGTTFIDTVIPQHVMRTMTETEMSYYRQPFTEAGTGKSIAQYLNVFKDKQEETKLNNVIKHYTHWLTVSRLPKLMLYSVPGFITTIATIMWAKNNLPTIEIVDIGEELHLAQETCPNLMGETMSVWLQGVEQQMMTNHSKQRG